MKNKLELGEAYLEISIVIPPQEKKNIEQPGWEFADKKIELDQKYSAAVLKRKVMMKLQEFEIGKIFICDKRQWQVTDVGSRVVIAIAAREGWMNGPPYALSEMVFDENDQIGCSQSEG